MKDERIELDGKSANQNRISQQDNPKRHSKSSSFILHPSSFLTRWRHAILGSLLVLAGLATAALTLLARQLGEPGLAGVGAVASLVFALLITILIVPPLS